MTNGEAKAIFLLERCPECEHGNCEQCEINKAIEALEAVMRVETAITELEEQRYYKAAEIVRKAVE